MTSFRSRFYPSHTNALMLRQEHAMNYYAGFTAALMLGILVMVVSGKGTFALLAFSLIGAVVSIVMGNVLAGVKLNRLPAEIFFIEDQFSLISVQALLDQSEHEVFPLAYASAISNGNVLQFHFQDQVLTIRREDWEEFDLICQWMYAVRG